jgi:3D (Asp-Asp-Asp) domain-containing protein
MKKLKRAIFIFIIILIANTITANGVQVIGCHPCPTRCILQPLKEIVKPSRGDRTPDYILVKATAYDLGFNSCGKKQNHPAYGITASGFSLKGLYWETDKYIAVDPKVIPLGSFVEVIFQTEYHSIYSGVYKAVDTGSAIKGNRIDVFIGDFKQSKSSQEALDFGVAEAFIRIIEPVGGE